MYLSLKYCLKEWLRNECVLFLCSSFQVNEQFRHVCCLIPVFDLLVFGFVSDIWQIAHSPLFGGEFAALPSSSVKVVCP